MRTKFLDFTIRLLFLLFVCSFLPGEVRATPPNTILGSVAVCDPNSPQHCSAPDSSGNLPVTGTFSATLGGFAPATTGTPIAVTTGGVTGTLPAGAVVAAFNVGTTNTAFCKLGASSTTSDIAIPPQSWFGFTVGASTQLTCITSTSTTTVNMIGGSGLPTGAGGGGGGGGGGGAITAASGSYASGALSAGAFAAGSGVDGWDLTQGAKTDAACAGDNTSGCTVEARLQRIAQNLTTLNTTASAAIPAGINTIGNVGADPSSGKATPTSVAINVSTATTTQLVALSGSTVIYVTSFDVIAGGTGNITFEYGTGASCGTGTTALTGAYNLTAQAGISKGNGAAMVLKVPAGNALCVLTSAAVQMSGSVSYQQF